jgi:hypothetical protein
MATSAFSGTPGSAGVASLNTLTGALALQAGTGISVSPSGSDIIIANTASGSGAGPTVTPLTFGAITSAACFGVGRGDGLTNAFPSNETFSGFLHLKVRLVCNRPGITTADGIIICLSKDATHSYNFAAQYDANLEVYYADGGSSTTLFGGAVSHLVGNNYLEFELSVLGAGANQLWGQLNSARSVPAATQSDASIDLSTGAFTVYIVAPRDTAANIKAAFVETW